MKHITNALLIVLVLSSSFVMGQPKKLNVITTLNYLRYVAAEVGGERVEVTALANPRQDPHYVTPTPRMNQLAQNANLFIENGLALDLWAKNVLDASGNPNIGPGSPGHLVATINVPVKELPTEVSRSWGDIHPQGNPHVWLDPFNMKIIAENIADKLKKLDPGHASEYDERCEAFKSRIDVAMFGEDLLKSLGKSGGSILSRKAKSGELTTWLAAKGLQDQLGGWMKKALALSGVKVISYHKTYIYLADRFGFVLAGELEEKPGIPPPPQHRDAIVEQVRQEGIKVILNDNFYSKEAAEYVASKTPAKVLVTYLDVGATDEVSTYEQLITYLVENISLSVK